MTRIRHLIAVAACAAVPAGCGDDSADSADRAPADATEASQRAETSEPAPTAETGAARRGPLVKLRDSQFGPVIFNGRDQAAYFFTRDRGGKSRCYGECAVAWPPFYARGKPRAGRGVKKSLLGTVARRGRRQVTYAGQPLYFYAHDPKGQVLCNDIVEFGGTWFAVTPEGKAPST